MSHIIEVPIRFQHRYKLWGGENLWDRVMEFASDRYPDRLCFICIDENVERLYGEKTDFELQKYFQTTKKIVIPEGEPSKSITQWNKITDFLLKEGVERSTPLFAIGGGVTGDLAGFAASTALRGIPLIHMPTTLLAMVDSSIGGKTGVNHEIGKNTVGSFYQPDAVFADIAFLETLDRTEWINGVSEILKYGAIRNPGIFQKLEDLIDGVGFRPAAGWSELIATSAGIKADIVEEDTRETGQRAFLNFGHTFGHALEKTAGYGSISHGQAVFVGMVAAIYASKQLGAQIEPARFDPFRALYPLKLDDLAADKNRLVESMRKDKKVKNEQIRLVLLNDWGAPYIHVCADTELIEKSWDHSFNLFN